MSYLFVAVGSIEDAVKASPTDDNNHQYLDSSVDLVRIIALALEDGVIPVITNVASAN